MTPPQRLRILVVTSISPPDIGGPATYVWEFAKLAKAMGHTIKIITLTKDSEKPEGIEVIPVGMRAHPFKELSLLVKILKHSRGMDVIYAQNPTAIGMPCVVAGKMLRKPVVIKYVGDTAWEKAFREFKTKKLLEDFLAKPDANKNILAIEKRALAGASMVITPSQFLKKILTHYLGVKDSKVTVVNNAVDLSGMPARATTPQPRILTVARLVPWKGIQHVISILPELLQQFPGLEYRVVGDGPYRGELEKLAEQKGVKDSVRFLGRLPKQATLREMASADVFVLNTLYEGMPHVVIECMAAGTPVAASDICGNPEVIGEDGILFEPNNTEEIKHAITKLLSDKQLAREIASRASQKVRKYNWDKLMDETLAALSSLA